MNSTFTRKQLDDEQLYYCEHVPIDYEQQGVLVCLVLMYPKLCFALWGSCQSYKTH